MTDMDQIQKTADAGHTDAPPRKPRLALMGEFSAGKSTLTNMLLGMDPLPTRVTATRLPPVWISYGEGPATRIDMQGQVHEIDGDALDQVVLEDTRLIRLSLKSDSLELCDLIDLPGISDPNMSAEVWQGVMDDVDCVVWCTHATQAWRQSEAGTWDLVAPRTNGRNLMLVTQMDKLTSQRDRDRVMARVRQETEGLFEAHYPISLTQAMAAGEDCDQWASSGAAAFTEHLVDLLLHPGTAYAGPSEAPEPQVQAEVPENQVLPKRVRNRPGDRLRTRPLNPQTDSAAVKDLLIAVGERV